MSKMNLRIQEVDFEGIDRNHAIELMNEIQKAAGDKLHFGNEYPKLREIYKLLNTCFISSVRNVHSLYDNE